MGLEFELPEDIFHYATLNEPSLREEIIKGNDLAPLVLGLPLILSCVKVGADTLGLDSLTLAVATVVARRVIEEYEASIGLR